MSTSRYPRSSERDRRRVVLLVEDEPFVREATERILQSAGFEVLPAVDAQDALRAYEQSECRVDLLMSDLVLPGRSGRELGQEIHRRSPRLPILLTSGYLCADVEEEQGDGCTSYLPKPYSRSDLLQKLAEIFRKPMRNAAQAG